VCTVRCLSAGVAVVRLYRVCLIDRLIIPCWLHHDATSPLYRSIVLVYESYFQGEYFNVQCLAALVVTIFINDALQHVSIL
jgi:hypothetical protein